MTTIVKREKIFKYLESLRKIGFEAYVLQWATNEYFEADFIIRFLPDGKLNREHFLLVVESFEFRSQREKEELKTKSVSNTIFKKGLLEWQNAN